MLCFTEEGVDASLDEDSGREGDLRNGPTCKGDLERVCKIEHALNLSGKASSDSSIAGVQHLYLMTAMREMACLAVEVCVVAVPPRVGGIAYTVRHEAVRALALKTGWCGRH